MELNNKHKQLNERTEIDEKIVTIENIDFDQLEQIKNSYNSSMNSPQFQLSSINKNESECYYSNLTPKSQLSCFTNMNPINYIRQSTPRRNREHEFINSRGFASKHTTDVKNITCVGNIEFLVQNKIKDPEIILENSIILKNNIYNNETKENNYFKANIPLTQNQPSYAEKIRTPPNEINKCMVKSIEEENTVSKKIHSNSNQKSIISEESRIQISKSSIEQESLIHRSNFNNKYINKRSTLELFNKNNKKNQIKSDFKIGNPMPDLQAFKHLAHLNNRKDIRRIKNIFGKFYVRDEDMTDDRINYSDKSLFIFSRTNRFRVFLFRLAENQYFDFFIIFIIIFNSIVLAFALSLDLITTGFDFMDVIEYIFVVIYTLESLIKIIAYGFFRGEKSFLKDTWNKLDFLVMINGLICLYPGMGRYKELKIFRTFRPLRSISFLPGLRHLVNTVVLSMRQFFHLFLLLSFFYILYGVLGVSLWSGLLSYRCRETSTPFKGGYNIYDSIPKICGGYFKCPQNTTCESLTNAYDSKKYFLLMNNEDLYQEQDIPELYYGFTNFNHIGSAFLSIFQSATLEGWSNIMFTIQNGYNFYTSAIYFISLIIIVNYFIINFTVAIMMDTCRSSYMDQDEVNIEEKLKKLKLSSNPKAGVKIIEFNFFKYIRKFFKFIKRIRPFKYVEINVELYNYHKKWKIAYYSYVVINQPIFDFLIYLFILVNIILLASIRDEDKNNFKYNSTDNLFSPSEIFNYVLVFLFCIESTLKLIASGLREFFRKKYNIFDLIILLISIYEILILNKTTFAILRVLRIYRLFKLMTKWRTVAIILKCIHATVKEMGYYILLLFILIYVFALIGMNFFKGTLKFDQVTNKYSEHGILPKVNFENMYQSMVAVFVLITGDNWSNIMFMCLRSPKTSKIIVYIFFITVIVFLNIIMLNLVIAFLVYIFEKSRKKFQFQEKNRQINEYLKARKIKNSMSFSFFPDFELREMIKPLDEKDYDDLDEYIEKEKLILSNKNTINNFSPKSFVKKKNCVSSMLKKSPLKSRRSTEFIFDFSKAGLSEKKQIRDSNTDKLINLEPILFETFGLEKLDNEYLKSNQLKNDVLVNNYDFSTLSGINLSRKIMQKSLLNYKSKLNHLKNVSTIVKRKRHTNLSPEIKINIPASPDILKMNKKHLYNSDDSICRDKLEKKLKKHSTYNLNINMNMNINLNMNMNLDVSPGRKNGVEVSSYNNKNRILNKLTNIPSNYIKFNELKQIDDGKHILKELCISKNNKDDENFSSKNDYSLNICPSQITNKSPSVSNFKIIELKKAEIENHSEIDEKVLNEEKNEIISSNNAINLSNNLKEDIKEEIKSIIHNTIQSMKTNINPMSPVTINPVILSNQKTRTFNQLIPQKSLLKSFNQEESFLSQNIEDDCEANKKKVTFKNPIPDLEDKERRLTVKDKAESKMSRAKTIFSLKFNDRKTSKSHSILKYISNASLLIFHKDWKLRKFLVVLVNSGWFESIASLCIVLSNIVLILDTSYIDPTSTYKHVLSTLDSIFSFIFFAEMLMKIIAFGLLFDSVSKINKVFDDLKGELKNDAYEKEEKKMNELIEMRKNYVKMEIEESKKMIARISRKDNNEDPKIYNGLKNNYVDENINQNPILLKKPSYINIKEIISGDLNTVKVKEQNSKNHRNGNNFDKLNTFDKPRQLQEKEKENFSSSALENANNLINQNKSRTLIFLENIPNHYWQRAYLRNLFNIVDSFVITISLIDFFSSDSLFNGSLFKQMKTLRALRALRPLRMINRFTELRLVVNCIIDSIPAIANMLVIVSFIFFVYAVIGLNLYHGYLGTCSNSIQNYIFNFPTSHECISNNGTWTPSMVNFDSISSSMLAVFEMASTSNWYEVMYKIVEKTNRYSSIYFVSFMLIGAIFAMNLSVTVIVDNFVTLNEAEEGITMISDEQKEWVKAMKYFLKYKPVPCYKTRKFSKIRKFCFNLVNNKRFNTVINCMILINVIIMCIRYDRDGELMEDMQSYISYFFSSLFTLELVIKLMVYRKLYFVDVWNKFDFIVVIISNCSVILNIVRYYKGDISENSFLTVMIRIIRILRVFRLLKINEYVKNYFYTLLFLFPSLINIGSLVLVILTVYSILGMNLFGTVKFGDNINSNNNFINFLNSMIFLIRTTTGDAWNDSMHELASKQPNCKDQTYEELLNEGPQGCGSYYAYFYFVSFMIINSMVIMNLFIAVVVDSLIRDTETYDAVDPDQIKDFFELWGKYDPEVLYMIDPQDFVLLMMELPTPLGINGDKIFEKELSQKILHGNIYVSYDNKYFADDKQCIKILTKLKIEARKQKIHIIDAIKCVTKRAVIADRDNPDTSQEYETKFCKLDEINHERFNRKLNQKFGEYDGFYNEQVEKKMSNFVVASKVIGNFLIRWRRRRLDRIKEKK